MFRALNSNINSLVIILALSLNSICIAKENIQIVTTSLPLYNLVYSITKGISTPKYIVSDSSCPHSYALKPSDVKTLKDANIVIWGGESIEPFMAKPISQLNKETVVLDLSKLNGISLLPLRTPHHHSHDHGNGHTHAHDHGHTHNHDHSNDAGHSHHDHNLSYDPHYWLSPSNAKLMLQGIAKAVVEVDSAYNDIIQRNLENSTAKIDYATSFIKDKLQKRKIEPFLTFHDAFQYFEQFFSIKHWGTITTDPNSPPKAKHLQSIHEKISKDNIMCIYSEPGFSSKIISSLKSKYPRIEYLNLNPIGDRKDSGDDGYIKLLENLANGYFACSTKR